jgi:hypothetical protein
VTTLLPLAVLVVLTLYLTLMLSSYPVYALGAWTVVSVLDAFTLYPGISLGTMRITAADTVGVATLAALVLRGRSSRIVRPSLGYLLVLALVLVNVARGALAFDLATAANEIRTSLIFASALVYFSSIVIDDAVVAAFVRLWPASTVVFAAAAIAFVAGHGIDSYQTEWERGLIDNRPLAAGAALMVAQAAFVLLLNPRSGGTARWWPLAACFGLLLLSSQRTVWVATAVALAAALALSRRLSEPGIRRRVTRVGAAAGAGLTALLAGGFRSAWFALDTAFRTNSTFQWRVDGWAVLLRSRMSGDTVDLLFGQPAGYGFDRLLWNVLVSFSPHSGYVTPLLVVGVIGTAALLLAYLGTLRRLVAMIRRRDGTGTPALLFAVLAVMNLVYFVSYAGTAAAGVVMGLATGYALHTPPRLSTIHSRSERPVDSIPRRRLG